MDTLHCPHCGRPEGHWKIGHNDSGSQRYICKVCQRKYTPEPKRHGYDATVREQAGAGGSRREQAVRLSVDGMNLRRIGRLLGVTHQSVANWVAAHARTLPAPPLPVSADGSLVAVGELDELYTFEGAKKSVFT